MSVLSAGPFVPGVLSNPLLSRYGCCQDFASGCCLFMLSEQWLVFLILGITLGLFVWNRLRFDVVALLALLAVAVAGLVPADELFAGFGHPAVITVAAVLVISQGLVNGGVVDAVARLLARVGRNAVLQVVTLTLVVALCSGFINNVGALALLMPVAVWMSRQAGRSPSLLLICLLYTSPSPRD